MKPQTDSQSSLGVAGSRAAEDVCGLMELTGPGDIGGAGPKEAFRTAMQQCSGTDSDDRWDKGCHWDAFRAREQLGRRYQVLTALAPSTALENVGTGPETVRQHCLPPRGTGAQCPNEGS